MKISKLSMLRRMLSMSMASVLLLTGCVGGGRTGQDTDTEGTRPTDEATRPETAGDTAASTEAFTEACTEASTEAPVVHPVTFTEGKLTSGSYPNVLTLTPDSKAWSLDIAYAEKRARFHAGHFGEMELKASRLFTMTVRGADGTETAYDSTSEWGAVSVSHGDGAVVLRFSEPEGIAGLSVEITGQTDEQGISWYTSVTNQSTSYTVMSITYPTPLMQNDTIHVFLPERSGRELRDANKTLSLTSWAIDYPGHLLSMPYFAYYGNESGIYLGVHDPDGSMKSFSTSVNKKRAELTARFPAIGAGNVGNSFDLGGYMRWEALEGDWYDATLLYADFVHNNANWLPEKGRPDTAEKFKEIAMWLVDYTHSTDLQAALYLREQLGYPIAVHAYCWHAIDFDTYYPHFLPAKSNTVERFTRLRNADIYVVPYINAVSWGTLDASQGYEVNYDNTGVNGVAMYPDGSVYVVPYANPLAVMCPYFMTWRDIIKQLVRDMEEQLPIDGVYYDQIAAVAPIPCSDPTHGHVTGGGSYWSEGYNDIMSDIISGRPEESFYFSESTGETYVKTFDGLLSWMWNLNDMVPAFPMVYTGYVQMVGRNSDAVGTENGFRYHFGEAMLFGQQPGWASAGQFLSAPQSRIDFMKRVVDVRMQYIDLFNYGKILRPPVIETEIAPVDGYRQVISAVWQDETGKTVLFIINVSEQTAPATLTLYPEEYGVDAESTMTVELAPMEVRVIELN